MKLYESAEDYLEKILMLSQKNQHVRSIDIAREMGFSKPSVSVAMHKLFDNGYIDFADNGDITLTESGLKIANKIYERHIIISSALMKMGVSEEQAMIDACKIEHDISEETFNRLKEIIK